MIEWLKNLINIDSPSNDKVALDTLARNLGEQLSNDGGAVEIIPNKVGGNHLIARFAGHSDDLKPILILGHLDTVWDKGESGRRPARLENGKLFGPGAFDMRGGITLILAMVHYLSKNKSQIKRPFTILFDSDEEVGTPTARTLIESEAKKSAVTLVLEPCIPGGALKTARKGVGTFKITASGLAAHAGIDYHNGVSAIQEVAHQILQLYDLNDFDKGTTVNPGVIRGGSRSNVVADQAEIEVDIRVKTISEGKRLVQKINALQTKLKGTVIKIEGSLNRPPLERTTQVIQLFQRARKLATELGIELREGSTGGGSDGCFTADMGIPTLDGLGPDGSGAHALDEHVVVESLVPRAALLTHLVLNL
ncbi:MAG: M20 family metallopeptidase [Acidobacteriia bacterium]|nr:M20 family metallopeptidase [Terriglobia bacterium]